MLHAQLVLCARRASSVSHTCCPLCTLHCRLPQVIQSSEHMWTLLGETLGPEEFAAFCKPIFLEKLRSVVVPSPTAEGNLKQVIEEIIAQIDASLTPAELSRIASTPARVPTLLLGLAAKKPQLEQKLAMVVVQPFLGAALDRLVEPWPKTLQETGKPLPATHQMQSFDREQSQQWLELREKIVKAAKVDQKAVGLLLDLSSHSMDPVRAVHLAVLVAGNLQEVSISVLDVCVSSRTPLCSLLPCTDWRRSGGHHTKVIVRANPFPSRRRTCGACPAVSADVAMESCSAVHCDEAAQGTSAAWSTATTDL